MEHKREQPHLEERASASACSMEHTCIGRYILSNRETWSYLNVITSGLVFFEVKQKRIESERERESTFFPTQQENKCRVLAMKKGS